MQFSFLKENKTTFLLEFGSSWEFVQFSKVFAKIVFKWMPLIWHLFHCHNVLITIATDCMLTMAKYQNFAKHFHFENCWLHLYPYLSYPSLWNISVQHQPNNSRPHVTVQRPRAKRCSSLQTMFAKTISFLVPSPKILGKEQEFC